MALLCLVQRETIVYVERLPTISSQCATMMDAIFVIEQVDAHAKINCGFVGETFCTICM